MLLFSGRSAPSQHQRMSIGRCRWQCAWQKVTEHLGCDNAARQPMTDATNRSGSEEFFPHTRTPVTAAPAAGGAGMMRPGGLGGDGPPRTAARRSAALLDLRPPSAHRSARSRRVIAGGFIAGRKQNRQERRLVRSNATFRSKENSNVNGNYGRNSL